MSVLYKALARAAKSRDAAAGGGGPSGMGGPAPRRGGSSRLRPLVILVLLIIVFGGGYLFFGDDIADTVHVILYGEPAPPPPIARKARPPAAVATAPSAPLSALATSTPISAATPATAAATATPSAPIAPSAALSAPSVAASAPISPSASPAAAVPASSLPAAATLQPLAEQPAEISPEQNLPAILDRIRQQRGKATIEPSAVVNRVPQGTSGAPDTAATAVDGMVSVSQETTGVRDDTERAYDMLLHGQYQGALDLYDAVLKTSPDYEAALLGKATALHKLRRPQEARPLYQRVLGLDPQNREALTNMTAIIAAEAPAAALRELRELQKTNPEFSPIPAQIAEIAAHSGNLSEAIASFGRAIQLSPENGLYRLNLAIVQDRAGMAREAAASYQAALDRFDPSAQLPIPIEAIRARLRYLRSR